jgi:hypothetical protein
MRTRPYVDVMAPVYSGVLPGAMLNGKNTSYGIRLIDARSVVGAVFTRSPYQVPTLISSRSTTLSIRSSTWPSK